MSAEEAVEYNIVDRVIESRAAVNAEPVASS